MTPAMTVSDRSTSAKPAIRARDDAHRRQARQTDDASRCATPNRRGRRHGAGGAAPSRCAEAFAMARPSSPSSPATNARRSCSATAEILRDAQGEFARLITAESGLCLKDSLYEVGRAYDVYSLAGQIAIRDDGEIYSCDITPHGKARQIYTTRTPVLGCISAITPFNHPLNMVSHKIAPGDRHQQPRGAEADRADAADRAAAGRHPLRGRAAAGNAVGRDRQSAHDGRCHDHRSAMPTSSPSPAASGSASTSPRRPATSRMVLELGGNDPLIVMEDADLDKAAELAVQGATKNSGQRCTAVKRILVVEKVADEFVEAACSPRRKKLKCGDPMDPDTDIGTVIHERAASSSRRASTMPSQKGAKLLHGNDRKGALYPPTVRRPCALRLRAGARGDLRPGHPDHPLPERYRRGDPDLQFDGLRAVIGRLHEPARLHHPLHQRAGGRYREHLGGAGLPHRDAPFGGIKDSGLGYKEGVVEAMKSFTNVRTYSLPWPA